MDCLSLWESHPYYYFLQWYEKNMKFRVLTVKKVGSGTKKLLLTQCYVVVRFSYMYV